MTMPPRISSELLVIASILNLSVFACVPVVSPQTTSKQAEATVHLKDDSDWWSITKGFEHGENVKSQERELPPGSFQIVGVKLGDELLADAQERLGPATAVERGDAGEWRRQICYVVAGESANTYLIFETGEIDRAFYLFNGAPWKGQDSCSATNLVPGKLATGSGLHIGESPAEIIAMLGKPSGQREGELVYLVEYRKRNSAEELKELRKKVPAMSDEEFAKSLAVADLTAIVVLKFAESKLNYIAVSKSETY
jgi:hypothetical protein